jgi:NADPH:quinone reductase-like Zn-dependent oxidoreductase
MRLTDARSENGVAVNASHVVAAVVDAPGAEPRVGFVDLPQRMPGTTLISVVAAPLNPLDLLIASGSFHSVRHEDPYVPGSECVGRVVESDSFTIGSLVYAECKASPLMPGAFAERTIIPDDDLLPLPDGIEPVLAAAIGNSGVAAYIPLVEIANMRSGETVLILGATGAVGQLAVQIAHRRGAGRVIGVARDRGALDRLLNVGADAVIQLRADEGVDDLAVRLEEVTGPVDVVVDCLYGIPLEAALRVCGQHARVVNIGHSAAPVAEIPAGLLRGKQITLTGFAGLHTPLRDKRDALSWLWAGLAVGDLKLEANAVPLAEISSAWRAQARSSHTKYVVLPSETSHPETTGAHHAR